MVKRGQVSERIYRGKEFEEPSYRHVGNLPRVYFLLSIPLPGNIVRFTKGFIGRLAHAHTPVYRNLFPP